MLGDKGPSPARTPRPEVPPIFTSRDRLRGEGLAARTEAPSSSREQRGGRERQGLTACSFPDNVTSTSWQLALGGPGQSLRAWPPHTRPLGMRALGWGGCRPEGSGSWSAARRPLSFQYILTRKPAGSACRTSQKGWGASDVGLRAG